MRTFLCLAVVAALALSAEAGYKMRNTRMPENLRHKTEFRRQPLEDESRIVGGQEVEPHSIPYQISMQSSFGHRCGGSILDQTTVITAAHCCDGQEPEDVIVLAGAHNKSMPEDEQQRMGVRQVIIHESYDSRSFANDICLLKLDGGLVLTAAVQGVELPVADNEPQPGTYLTVSGWGTTSSGGSSPDTLRSVRLPIVSDEQCREGYGQEDVLDSMICAGDFENGGIDSCQGDSGGPLVCENNNGLCGIVSWGYGCAVAGKPGVNTQVSYFIDWIVRNA